MRHFLFLQGLPGPFFRLLGAELRDAGARVSRVNVCGGDWYDWRGGINYRAPVAVWGSWLDAMIAREGVTDIVLFGDCRPHHVIARGTAARQGVTVHVVEEGYLRPDWITIEHGGVNGNSSLPSTVAALRALDPGPDGVPTHAPVTGQFGRRARESALHATATLAARLAFPHYRTHRAVSPLTESLGWARRWWRRGREQAATEAGLAAVAGRRTFLLPLQLDGDAQLTHHCDWPSMADAASAIVASFADHAPEETMLLVKRHPLDPDLIGWRARIAAIAAEHDATDRIVYIERGDLAAILPQCVGVATVNSTVGPLALKQGVPVIATGFAVYNIDGLTFGGTLAEFWRDPGTVDADALGVFTRTLRAHSLVNGGFHSAEGLALAVRNSARVLMERAGG